MPPSSEEKPLGLAQVFLSLDMTSDNQKKR